MGNSESWWLPSLGEAINPRNDGGGKALEDEATHPMKTEWRTKWRTFIDIYWKMAYLGKMAYHYYTTIYNI